MAAVTMKKGKNWAKIFPGNWQTARTKSVIHAD
jgi:hypothetical protein